MQTSLVGAIMAISSLAVCLFSLSVFLRRKEDFFLFSYFLFLFVHFLSIEWTFWTIGYNLFSILGSLNFPISSYFASWIIFTICLCERLKRRKYWVVFLIILIFGWIIGVNCMNCLSLD